LNGKLKATALGIILLTVLAPLWSVAAQGGIPPVGNLVGSVTVSPSQALGGDKVTVTVTGYSTQNFSPNPNTPYNSISCVICPPGYEGGAGSNFREPDASIYSVDIIPIDSLDWTPGGPGVWIKTFTLGTWIIPGTYQLCACYGYGRNDWVLGDTSFTILSTPPVQLKVSPTQGKSGDNVVFTLINYVNEPNLDNTFGLIATKNDPSLGTPSTSFAFTAGGVDNNPSPKWIQAASDAWTITYTLGFSNDNTGNYWVYATGGNVAVLAFTSFNFLPTQSPSGSYLLTLVHHGAFDQDVLANQAIGGEVTATLTSNSKPVPQANIYFFAGITDPAFYSDHGRMPIMMPDQNFASSYLKQVLPLLSLDWGQSYGGTYSTGVAHVNYVLQSLVDYSLLQEYLQHEKSLRYSTRMTIYAVAFDQSLSSISTGGKPKPIAFAYVEFYYDSIAIIAKISYAVALTQTTQGASGPITNTYAFTNKQTPVEISPDDTITIQPGSMVIIVWLSGTRLTVSPATSASVSFNVGTEDMGYLYGFQWWATRSLKVADFAHIFHGACRIFVELPVLGGAALWPAIPHVVGITLALYGLEYALEPSTETESYKEPIIMGIQSRILVEQGLNSTEIYTLEGQATLYRSDDSEINVTTGNSINFDQNGTYGSVEPFSTSQLSFDQKDLLNFAEIQNVPSSTISLPNPTSTPAFYSAPPTPSLSNLFPDLNSSPSLSPLESIVTTYLPYLIVGAVAVVVACSLLVIAERKREPKHPPYPLQSPIQVIICPNCGTQLNPNVRFCTHCGQKLRQA
jgi:hypothetical protein